MTPIPRSSPQKRLYLAGALGVLVRIDLSIYWSIGLI